MERYVDLNQISDGKKYTSNDLVKIGSGDCAGCDKCCHHMDKLITLDPYDCANLCHATGKSFSELLENNVEFTVDNGVIIPCLAMGMNDACTFLNPKGRCSIHSNRPGICRLFPMGRIFENKSFYYFYQKDECDYSTKTKVKLKNWLNIPDIKKYERYVCDWHYFIKDIQEELKKMSEEEIKNVNMSILEKFFIVPYDENFYDDFYRRLSEFL